MTWHATADLPAPNETELSSLAVAFSNLLLKFGIERDPISVRLQLETDNEPLDWAAITSIDPRLMPTRVGDHTNWPNDAHTIIRFSYIKENGQPADHYCVVANPANHTIIDSKDGKVQYSGIYGEPVGWASYAFVELEDEADTPDETTVPEEIILKQRTGVLFKVVGGDNVYTISTRYQLSVDDILEHNELKDPSEIKAGMYIYLPLTTAQKDNRPVSYEILATPRAMHVSHAGGAKKWSFGNVRTWKDIRDNGQHYQQNHNLMIVAIAHVPIEEDTAAYYMDAISFGSFKTTGLVRYTTGFNWQHLADGHVFPDYVPQEIIDADTVKVIEDAVQEVEVIPEPDMSFKETYRPLVPGPVLYQFAQSVIIHDLEGKRHERVMEEGKPITIAGTFEVTHEGKTTTYGLPAPLIKDGVIVAWYGIKMTDLYIEDELYNEPKPLKLSDKVSRHRQLSVDEKIAVFIARNAGKVERLKAALARKK